MSYFRPRYKCCFIGPYGAGKTSFIRSVLGMSLDRVQTTLGIDFFTTSLSIHNTTVHITLWDTAGAERYRSLMHSYVRDSDIVFVMYDITDQNAMSSVEHCFRDLESYKPSVVAVVGTKMDLGRCTHDLHGTIEPWARQPWQIVTGVCSSRQPATTKKILKRCLDLMVGVPNPQNSKPISVRLTPVRTDPKKCCT